MSDSEEQGDIRQVATVPDGPWRPVLEFFDHLDGGLQNGALSELLSLAEKALLQCLANPAAEGSAAPRVLGELERVEVSVISDSAIAAVHADFMDDPTPTDVITFHHGEILVSADTAQVRATELGQPLLRELLLYVIHGFLHLNGHEDLVEEDQRRMHAIQDRILQDVWPLPQALEK